MPSSLLDSLNEEQREVVVNNSGPALVLAGPGSGKTRALTHKIAYLVNELQVRPDDILSVTFTNKAAKEMRERITDILSGTPNSEEGEIDLYGTLDQPEAKIPSWIGTFHSISARILRIDGRHIEVGSNFVIYDTSDSQSLVKQVLDEMDLSAKDFTPASILGAISKAKGEMIFPDKFVANSPNSYFYEVVAKIYTQYQKKLKENNALDFNDLLLQVVKLFNDKPEILEKYQNGFKHILVDEYQDTNRVQYHIINLLAKKHQNLTVVGDISQSIYSWRGADYRNMQQFQNDYPDAKVFQLAKNYRSTANILNAAKELIQNNKSHIHIDLYTENPMGDRITLFEAEHERSEAKYIADLINFNAYNSAKSAELQPEYKYDEFAILYRTNAQSRAIEEALLNQGIPYRIIGGLRFYDRKEVKDVLAYLRVFYNPSDTISWGRSINTPPRKIGAKTLEKISDAGFDLEMVKELTGLDWAKNIEVAKNPDTKPIELIDEVLKTFGYLQYLNDGTEESLARIENIKELRSVAKQYESLPQFLENVSLLESSNRASNDDDNNVTMMTMHAAKGLEFDNVFIAGIEEGILPHGRALADPNELEEERRLCYVAITRARKNLYMTYTRQRSFYGGTGSSIISRFVSEIPEDLIEFKMQ